jgi:hypothetical protein
MEPREEVPRRVGPPSPTSAAAAELANARTATPIAALAFVRLALARYWRVFLVITGVVVQVVLTLLMWQLVDLTIGLMELWVELARKHLELTL